MEQEQRTLNRIQRENDVTMRHASRSDMFSIEGIIKEEAIERGVPQHEHSTVKHLLADALESKQPWCRILMAESHDELLGVAIYYHRYWSWSGRTIYLNGLHVRPTVCQEVGRKLFLELCRVAHTENAQLDWQELENDFAATGLSTQFRAVRNIVFDGHYMMKMNQHVIQAVAKGMPVEGANLSSKGIEQESKAASGTSLNQSTDANKTVTVRPTTREDAPALKAMIQELADLQEYPNGPQLSANDLMRDGFDCPHPWFFALVAERNGEVVGMIMGTRARNYQGRSFYLQGLYVRSSARRCGVAEKLVREFCRAALEESVDYIDFHVANDNAPALALYRRFHAVEVPGHDEIPSFRLTIKRIGEIIAETPSLRNPRGKI